MSTLRFTPAPLQNSTALDEYGIALSIKRDDLIHPVISGNKARKLQFIADLRPAEYPTQIVTMAGNRSNYLHALAFLCHQKNISLRCYIRGHQPAQYFSTLADCERWGVELEFVSKAKFQALREQQHLESYCREQSWWLPEGGFSEKGLLAVAKAVTELEFVPDRIYVPVGTGMTALGIAMGCEGLNWHTQVIGVVMLKDATSLKSWLQQQVAERMLSWPNCFRLEYGFAGRGFAKPDPQLFQRQESYTQRFGIPLEPVYAVKTLDALLHDAKTCGNSQGSELPNQSWVYWHTGGLQGNG